MLDYINDVFIFRIRKSELLIGCTSQNKSQNQNQNQDCEPTTI